MLPISEASVALILAEEITDRAYYAKRYRHFQWPGGASGPTVGIGYDCGYAPRDEIAADWAGIIPKEMILALLEASGRKGAAAGAWVNANAQRVDISYEQAERQFRERELHEARAGYPTRRGSRPLLRQRRSRRHSGRSQAFTKGGWGWSWK